LKPSPADPTLLARLAAVLPKDVWALSLRGVDNSCDKRCSDDDRTEDGFT
jgi:hypothetical protein